MSITRKYLAVARVNYFTSVNYLVNVASRGLVVALRVWIFAQLYRATYNLSGEESIGGLTLPMVIWGLMLTQSFQSATRPPVARLIEDEVKSGTLAYSLNKPVFYPLFHCAGYLGRILPNILFNLAVGGLAALILVGPINWTVGGFILGLWLLFFGYILDFLIFFIIGLLSFWIEDISAFIWIYSKAQLVLGGLILPISLFPEAIRKVAELTPFTQLYYGAARLMVQFDLPTFFRFFSVQLFWLLVFGLTAWFVFRKGLKQVAINGG
ncbi:MAG: ABC-2 family transporter protein [Candidatus Liptonbacteria bacterium]|nr:ABC-2 family transporter protein [Candidatus Liptonbacteria bacterium]